MGYSLDLRIKSLESYESGEESQQDISDKFGISTSTFKRWLSRYRQGKALNPILEGRGRKRKLKESHLEEIRDLVESSPSITLRKISEYFEKKRKIQVGRSVLSRALQAMNLRYKKLSIQSEEKQTSAIKKKKAVSERNR